MPKNRKALPYGRGDDSTAPDGRLPAGEDLRSLLSDTGTEEGAPETADAESAPPSPAAGQPDAQALPGLSGEDLDDILSAVAETAALAAVPDRPNRHGTAQQERRLLRVLNGGQANTMPDTPMRGMGKLLSDPGAVASLDDILDADDLLAGDPFAGFDDSLTDSILGEEEDSAESPVAPPPDPARQTAAETARARQHLDDILADLPLLLLPTRSGSTPDSPAQSGDSTAFSPLDPGSEPRSDPAPARSEPPAEKSPTSAPATLSWQDDAVLAERGRNGAGQQGMRGRQGRIRTERPVEADREGSDILDLFDQPSEDPFREDRAPVPARRGAPGRQSPAERTAGVDDLDRLLKVGTARPTKASKWVPRIFWLGVLGVLTWLAFQPYAFEVGGDFVIQPFDRAEARARTDGEITVINVAQGDWVEKDQILAVISNWDEERDVILNETDDVRLRADLATLTQGASPEQINVAEEALRTAEVQVEIAARNLARQETLFASGTIPEKEMLASRDQHDLAIAARNQAQAGLDLVKADASQTEVDAQIAAIARNDEELSFARLMLEYTNVRAPAAGQIVSSMTEVPVGAYLSTGSLFAEIENNRTVIAEIDLPEITVEEVVLGATAELRLWSEPERSIFGTVHSIAPRAEESEFGPVIRVQVEVPNPDGDLSANMSGFGKISAGERPVWQVFSRAVYRFFTIEVWSWLP